MFNASIFRDKLIEELESYFKDTDHVDFKTISPNDLNALVCRMGSKAFVQEAISECLKMDHEALWGFEKEFKDGTKSSLNLYYMRIVFNSFMSLFLNRTESVKEFVAAHDWFEEHKDCWSGFYKDRFANAKATLALTPGSPSS